MLGGTFGSAMLIADSRFYYFMRNRVYIYKEYFSKLCALKFVIKQLIRYSIFSLQKGDMNKFFLTIRAIFHGWQEKWDKV